MKVRIIGPQNGFDRDKAMAAIEAGGGSWESHFLGIDMELPELPREGQSIILDGGSVYVVTDVSWFISTEAGERDALAEKKDTPGWVELVHVAVKPKEMMGTTYGNDFQMAEAARRLFDLLLDDRTAKRAQEK
jgi:hypothetical protein